MAGKSNFSLLKQRRADLAAEESLEEVESFIDVEPTIDPSVEVVSAATPKSKAAPKKSPSPPSQKQKAKTPIPEPEQQPRRVGRPAGRRSNPDYTQISAYIPLDLVLEVQDVLAEERRALRKRTARPVSDLVEELLTGWLKQQKTKKSKN
jgi:hypothetical protein